MFELVQTSMWALLLAQPVSLYEEENVLAAMFDYMEQTRDFEERKLGKKFGTCYGNGWGETYRIQRIRPPCGGIS